MLLDEILYECEVVYVDEDGNEILDEAFIRQLKKVGGKLKKQYRCGSGQKQGRIVATPQACGKRKDPAKRRHGKKVMRSKKKTVARKTKISKKRQISKMVTRINKRLSGQKSR